MSPPLPISSILSRDDVKLSIFIIYSSIKGSLAHTTAFDIPLGLYHGLNNILASRANAETHFICLGFFKETLYAKRIMSLKRSLQHRENDLTRQYPPTTMRNMQ